MIQYQINKIPQNNSQNVTIPNFRELLVIFENKFLEIKKMIVLNFFELDHTLIPHMYFLIKFHSILGPFVEDRIF